MPHCAKIEQIEDIDFEKLIVGQLFKSVLKFSLLPAKICPERISKLSLEIGRDEGRRLLTLLSLRLLILLRFWRRSSLDNLCSIIVQL